MFFALGASALPIVTGGTSHLSGQTTILPNHDLTEETSTYGFETSNEAFTFAVEYDGVTTVENTNDISVSTMESAIDTTHVEEVITTVDTTPFSQAETTSLIDGSGSIETETTAAPEFDTTTENQEDLSTDESEEASAPVMSSLKMSKGKTKTVNTKAAAATRSSSNVEDLGFCKWSYATANQEGVDFQNAVIADESMCTAQGKTCMPVFYNMQKKDCRRRKTVYIRATTAFVCA